jgi:cytochrome c-type biogenesis protein CcmH
MIGFWILAALVSVGAALLILLRAAGVRGDAGADPTRRVYARQLKEIDEQAARGLLDEAERKAAYAEAARRLIRAAETPEPAAGADAAQGRRLVLATVLIAPVLALGVYLAIGSPRLPDQPFAARLKSWRGADPASLDVARVSAILEQAARERPTDPEPLLFLARTEAAQGRMAQAVHSLEQAVRLAPGRGDLWAALGDGLADLGGGEMTPDARRAFQRSLQLDPKGLLPRYRLARADVAEGRVPQGLAAWRTLAADLPAGDARRAGLEREIAVVASTGKLPAAAAAPAPQEAAGEQRAFIQSMVNRLAARLKAQPEDPAGWTRLIRAYGVLGEADRRKAAIAEVERRYASRPAVMRSILQGG